MSITSTYIAEAYEKSDLQAQEKAWSLLNLYNQLEARHALTDYDRKHPETLKKITVRQV